MGRKLELINTKFGKDNDHTVLKETEDKAQGSIIYQCKCGKCGNEDWNLSARRIVHDNSISCGCLDNKSIGGTKHGMSNSKNGKKDKFYNIWCKMKSRTNGHSYESYVENNIHICDRWLSFENFKEDMYESYLEACKKYGESKVSIDRIDVLGDYEISNCRWTNQVVQSSNRDYTKMASNKPILATRVIDGFKVVTYNAKLFSRLIFNTPNHHIIDVCKGRRPMEKGWNFEYIDDCIYYNLKYSGCDYVENIEKFKISIKHSIIEKDIKNSVHDTKEEYLKSQESYYINKDNKIVKGLQSKIYKELGFDSYNALHNDFNRNKTKIRKLSPEEITLHLQGHQINF